jgi:hypothetical protein
MIPLDYFKNDVQSTKWGRMRFDFNLLERVVNAKEYMDENIPTPPSKPKLKVKTVIAF